MTPLDAHSKSRSPARRWLVPVVGVVGLGLLVYLIARLGPGRIATELAHMSAVLPAVLAITGTKYALQTFGWRLMLRPHERPPFGESLSATVTGDALGYLTWAGPFTGEPVRALLIRSSVPVAAGITAGAVERTMYHGVAAVFVWTVLLLLLAVMHPVWSAIALVLTLVAGAATTALVRGRLRATSAGSTRVARVRAAAGALWRDRREVLLPLALLELAQHALLVLEAYVLLGALGAAPTLKTAFIFEAVTKLVNTAGLLVPARLGVSEGGSALLAGALGFAASHGLSLALMRRIRALIWSAVGLALLPAQEARARRAAAKTT
jgi:hypothetical protein